MKISLFIKNDLLFANRNGKIGIFRLREYEKKRVHDFGRSLFLTETSSQIGFLSFGCCNYLKKMVGER